MPILMTIVLVLLWLGAVAMIILSFTTKTAQQVFAERIHRELQREEMELLDKKDQEELAKPMLQRLLGPILQSIGNKMMKKGKPHTGIAGKIEEKLEQAGHPLGMDAIQFTGLKLFTSLAMGAFGLLFAMIFGPFLNYKLSGLLGGADLRPFLYGFAFMGMLIGYLAPVFMLNRTIKKRRKLMGKAMADTIDLITLALEAGLGFDGAVGNAVKNSSGPLSEELARVMNEVAAGKPQAEAFRDLAVRVKMEELALMVAAIDQATKLGVSLANSLRAQATEVRERRAARAREQAAKLPVKMIFPLVFCIFPALFIVILGPAAIQMYQIARTGVI